MKHFYLFILLFCSSFVSANAQHALADKGGLIQKTYNASVLKWNLWGFSPGRWRFLEVNPDYKERRAEIREIPATVPGSVQLALKNAGIIKDWNIGLNHRESEWVENRSWMYSTNIPDGWVAGDKIIRLVCQGLDDNGYILVNGKEAGHFQNTFIPYSFDITPFLKESANTLDIVFDTPPRTNGAPYTSKVKDWKPRFYYRWDWMPRNVQIGIWDDLFIEATGKDMVVLDDLKVIASADRYKDEGELKVSGEMGHSAMRGKLAVKLIDSEGKRIMGETVPCTQIRDGKVWNILNVKRWYPNGEGEQPLYQLVCGLYDEAGNLRQEITRTIGFKNISWEPNKGAPAGADPWLCVVNNKPVFLQGVNWTPIRPYFADLREADYRKLITTYKNLGINIFRVWGGAMIEKKWFYDLCDEMGIMVWQEFPLSSSGIDNYPPETPTEIQTMAVIARSYVQRLRHHASLLMWCGGNELYELGNKGNVTDKHPMIRCIKEIVMAEDPGRRFVPGSPSGINRLGGLDNFGKGINWDTHGPWGLPFSRNDRTMAAVEKYWQLDDALMHSEVGASGAQSVEMTNKYKGGFNAFPANKENPLWDQSGDWVEWDVYLEEHQGKEPPSLNAYVTWSQERQAKGLAIALKACKKRFPACGGLIIWMGHDSFPCTANTSIIDFDGNPKPAAYKLSKIWKTNYKI